MLTKLRIGPKPPYRIYLPRDLVEKEGFKGELPVFKNAMTVVLLHPEASLENVERSLRIILDDIALRRELKQT